MNNLRGRVTSVAAALAASLASTFVGLPACAQTGDVPVPLTQTADCMYEVLKIMPGVTEPKLGYVTSNGWTHPFLEYRADEATHWAQPTRFEARRDDKGQYSFLGLLPGQIDPRIGHLDLHVTEAVTAKWNTQCHANAFVITE
jgi:hypothetical protein